MATPAACQYKNAYFDFDKRQFEDFTCHEPSHPGSKFCIFHDINYLKDDNCEKNEEVARKFEDKLSNHPRGVAFKFIG